MKKYCTTTKAMPSVCQGGTRVVCMLAALALAACGKSSPGVPDITPALMADINQCELWTVSDVKKVDGIPGKESYRVDFSAKITMKGTPEDALQKLTANASDPDWRGCLNVANRFVGPDMALWKSYDVTGFGEFIKSEKGWRLLGKLGQYEFSPVPGQPESQRAYFRPVPYKTQAAPPPAPAPVEKAVEMAPAEPELPPCVAAKMKAYDDNRSKEIEEMGKTAQANGEEVRTSAGMEEYQRELALEQAKVDCK